MNVKRTFIKRYMIVPEYHKIGKLVKFYHVRFHVKINKVIVFSLFTQWGQDVKWMSPGH